MNCSSDIPGFDDIISDDTQYTNPFRNLRIQHLQMAYYRKHFNFVVGILCIVANKKFYNYYFIYLVI